MSFLIKNKTTKNIVLLVDGNTSFLYPKGDKFNRDKKTVKTLTEQIKKIKSLKFIQISKVDN